MELWIAFGGLLFTVVSALMAFAYMMGRLSQRVTALESDGEENASLGVQFAEFRGEVHADLRSATEKIDELRKDLSWLRKIVPYEPNK